VEVDVTELPAVYGKEEFLLLILEGVPGGREEGPVSINIP
jgi:hypothetical protein